MRSYTTENRAVTSVKPLEPVSPGSPQHEGSSRALSVIVEALEFDVELARRIRARLEGELRRVQQHNSSLEAERASLYSRLAERERFLSAIHASSAWKLIQSLRGLVGRRW